MPVFGARKDRLPFLSGADPLAPTLLSRIDRELGGSRKIYALLITDGFVMIEWIDYVLAESSKLKPFATAISALASAFTAGLGVWKYKDQRAKRDKQYQIHMADAIVALEGRIKVLEKNEEFLSGNDPATWVEEAANEIKFGNFGKSISSTLNRLHERQVALYEIFLLLAEYYASDYLSSNGSLLQARRFCLLAVLIKPDEAYAKKLLAEVESTIKMLELRGAIDATTDPAGAAVDFDPFAIDPAISVSTIDHLLSASVQQMGMGQVLIAERLAARAKAIAKKFQCDTMVFFRSCLILASALDACGKTEMALKELDLHLESFCAIVGQENMEYLSGRFYRAKILFHLGRFQEALEVLNSAISVREKYPDSSRKDLHANIHLRAAIYIKLGQIDSANADLLTLERDAESGVVVAETMSLRANLLIKQGRYDSALSVARRGYTIAVERYGEGNPSAISHRLDLARAGCDRKIRGGNCVRGTGYPEGKGGAVGFSPHCSAGIKSS